MVSKAQYEKIALSFEGAEKGSSYGKPSILVFNKFFTRHRKDDDSIVLIVGSMDEREMLLEVEPEIFFITAHYKDYPAVLARLPKIDAATLRGRLEQHWRRIVPKKLLKAGEGNGAAEAKKAVKKKPAKPAKTAKPAKAAKKH